MVIIKMTAKNVSYISGIYDKGSTDFYLSEYLDDEKCETRKCKGVQKKESISESRKYGKGKYRSNQRKGC